MIQSLLHIPSAWAHYLPPPDIPRETWPFLGPPKLKDEVLENARANTEMIRQTPSHHRLASLAEGQPALIIGAGPSLARHFSLLRAAQHDFFLIAADAALPCLMKEGITPHLIFSIEANPDEYLFWREIDTTSLHLVASPWVAPRTLASWQGEITIFHPTIFHEEDRTVLDGILPIDDDFLPVRSVTQTMFYAAVSLLSCHPIIFIGQDFSFPHPDHYYARGGVPELRGNWTEFQSIRLNGTTLLFHDGLFLGKCLVENMIYQLETLEPEACLINATEGGWLGWDVGRHQWQGFLQRMTLQEAIVRYTHE